jgi:hypothetical protein
LLDKSIDEKEKIHEQSPSICDDHEEPEVQQTPPTPQQQFDVMNQVVDEGE